MILPTALQEQHDRFLLFSDALQQMSGDTKSLVHPDNARSIVRSVGDKLLIDIDRLDIFSKTSKIIPEWKPRINLASYASRSKIYLDIESTGGVDNPLVEAYEHDLIMIGLRNHFSRNKILRRDRFPSEKEMLIEWLSLLHRSKPDMLLGFNHFKFDLLFLIAKCEQWKVKHPFYISEYTSTFLTAQKFGQPFQFNQIYCKFGGVKTHIIDLYPTVLSFDYVARKLTSHNLKDTPLQLGLRKEERLDLGYQGILDCYAKGDYDTIQSYLEFDLEDTELLSDYLLPNIYNQQLFCVDLTLQKLATAGNGTKWNLTITRERGGYTPEPDEPKKIIGGKVYYVAGFYPNVSKFDVGGMYPSIQTAYGVHSCKDEEAISLGVLLYGKTVRYGFKTLKNLGDGTIEGDEITYLKRFAEPVRMCLEYSQRVGVPPSILNPLVALFEDVFKTNNTSVLKQFLSNNLPSDFFGSDGSIKVFNNSSFGFLNTKGIGYNDPVAGCLVTAYGRRIINFMMDYVQSNGGKVIGLDTDGLLVTSPNNDELFKGLQNALPEWIEIEHEIKVDYAYIPPDDHIEDFDKNYVFKGGKIANKNTAPEYKPSQAEKFFRKSFEHEDESDVNAAWRYAVSNYVGEKVSFDIMYKVARKFNFSLLSDVGKKKNYILFGKKVKAFGRYKKRDRSELEKTFHINFLQKYMQSPEAAEAYYQELRQQLIDRTYTIEKLLIRRTIRKGEKTLVELGIGKEKDNVALYQGTEGICSGEYDIDHYLRIVDEQYNELQTAFYIMREKFGDDYGKS